VSAVLPPVMSAVSGHVAVEHYLESEGLPFTVFQPLYIYGPHTAKDCEQWFIDRIIRCAAASSVLAGCCAWCREECLTCSEAGLASSGHGAVQAMCGAAGRSDTSSSGQVPQLHQSA
jgi:hypothetical protein